MMLSLLRDESFEMYEPLAFHGTVRESGSAGSAVSTLPLVKAKLRVPQLSRNVERTWLLDLLSRSAKNSAATCVIGRAGTGKTDLVANFAVKLKKAAWYTVDAGDSDWAAFQKYFRATVAGEGKRNAKKPHYSETPVQLFADLDSKLACRSKGWPSLIVLDGIHHVFDCDWFTDFFNFLIASLPHKSHVVMLSRSKPPNPVWRLKSKQVLSVIDERSLSFSASEARELFALHGLTNEEGVSAHRESFGKVAKLIKILERIKNTGERMKNTGERTK